MIDIGMRLGWEEAIAWIPKVVDHSEMHPSPVSAKNASKDLLRVLESPSELFLFIPYKERPRSQLSVFLQPNQTTNSG